MLRWDLVEIYRSSDRDHVHTLADRLRRAGIAAAFLPSHRVVGEWAVEVSPDDMEDIRKIVVGTPTP